jgi:perosamine synthetase
MARGEQRQFWPSVIGYKYKMTNLQAAIGCGQLERIDELIAGKRRIFEAYRQRLAGLPLCMNPEAPGTVNGCWMPTIVVDQSVSFDREQLLERFKRDQIDGRVFFWPLSSTPPFTACPENRVSYGLHGRAVNLPTYHDMTDSDIERVVRCVKESL